MLPRAAAVLSLDSDDELRTRTPDRAQRRWRRKSKRAANAPSSSFDAGLSATSSDVAECVHVSLVNIEERVPRIYNYHGSELANPASTLRHASILPDVQLRSAWRNEELPSWFACAGSKTTRMLGLGLAAWEADRSIKEDMGIEEGLATSGRRNRNKIRERKRRDSSASSDCSAGVFEPYEKLIGMFAAAQQPAQKDHKIRDKQTRIDSLADMLEQMEECRRAYESREAARAQNRDGAPKATSTSESNNCFEWQKPEEQRQAAFERMGKASDWTRSITRQYAEFEHSQMKRREKNQHNGFIRLRGKSKAFVKRSNNKGAAFLPSLLKVTKTIKMGKKEVNDVEWMDIPTCYEDSEDWKWERQVRLL